MEEELKRFVRRYVISHLISSYVDYEPEELEYTIFSCCTGDNDPSQARAAQSDSTF
jgi:hypothetical protein